MREVSYNELFNNIQCDYSVFFEDDFTYPLSFEIKSVLYRIVHMDVALIIEPMLKKLKVVDNDFAMSLEAFLNEFFKYENLIDDWSNVAIDDIETAFDLIKEKSEDQYSSIKEKYDAIIVSESEEVNFVLHQFGAFCVIPHAYKTVFDEYISRDQKWKPFCIYSNYSSDVKNELRSLLSNNPERKSIICCYIDNNLGGENKAEQIVDDLEELCLSNENTHFIGAVVTSKELFSKISDNIFIDYVDKNDMPQLKSALLRSIYHYFLHSLKEQYAAGINEAFSKAGSHRNIALYLSDMARYEGVSNYALLVEWLKELTDYYFAQDDSIGKLIAIANLIERQEETEEFDDDPCELSDINTFEAFDTKVNNYHQPVEPGDIFHTDNDKIFIVVGQACDMAMGESRTRRNGLCELVEAKFEVSVSSEKIHEDQKHFWINHYKKDDVWGALKIDYQKRYFVENEILSLSSFNSDGNCKIDLASDTISDPVLQQYQINMFADMKNFFQSVVSINDYCGDAASSVLANKNINWVYSLLDYKKEGSTLLYPLRRTCRLKEKYLLFLYKLFLEYRGRIPFNTVNMNRTVTIPMDFQYNQDSFSNSVDVLLKRSNCDIKTTWPWIVSNSTIKDILSKIQSSVSIKKEQDNYIIEGNNLDIDLSNGKKLRLTKKTRTSISITIV